MVVSMYMTKKLYAIGLSLIAVLVLGLPQSSLHSIASAKGTKGKSNPPLLSLKAGDWTLTGAPLANDTLGALYFDFSPTPVGYLMHKHPPRIISGSIILSLSVATTGTPVFRYDTEPFNTCVTPAHARPIIETSKGEADGFDRWWSNPVAYKLEAGSITLTIPLTPDRWSSVFGKFGNSSPEALAGFQTALQNVTGLGLTFGGGCFFGHGVYINEGTARFTLTHYEVQP
jgi:hypothetical protein